MNDTIETTTGDHARDSSPAAGYALPSLEESKRAVKDGAPNSLHRIVFAYTPAEKWREQRFRQEIEAALSYAYSLGWSDRADRAYEAKHNV